MERSSLEVAVTEASQIGEARRAAQRLGERAALDEEAQSNLAIVATELATNLVRHAGGGRILLRGDGAAVEIHAIDSGPGMDFERCARDGYSTFGSAGNGLGAIRRQAGDFDVYSDARGSVLWARVGRAPPAGLRVGAIALCHPGEVVCGDDWRVLPTAQGFVAMVADGLGHGPQAAEAAHCATAQLEDAAPSAILQRAHARMGGTRGGAVACVQVDRPSRQLRLASVGNVAAHVVERGGSRGLPGQNGTVGAHFPPRVTEFAQELAPTAHVLLHSDGIHSRWSLTDYPGLATCHPAVLAGVMLRDFRRGRDDATVLVLQCAEAA